MTILGFPLAPGFLDSGHPPPADFAFAYDEAVCHVRKRRVVIGVDMVWIDHRDSIRFDCRTGTSRQVEGSVIMGVVVARDVNFDMAVEVLVRLRVGSKLY